MRSPCSRFRAGRWVALAAVALLVGCAAPLTIPRDGTLAPPVRAADVLRDLRGAFRATLCGRPDIAGERCARSLQALAGERTAGSVPPADPARFRILFVPGFLSSCFPAFSTFEDAAGAANEAGYAVARLDVAGRASVEANAEALARQIEAMPHDDDRSFIVVAHSKGALDAIAMLVDHPDIASRTAAIVTVAGALRGSPLARDMRTFYRFTLMANPLLRCETGTGDELADLEPARREQWWKANASRLSVPIYSLVALPDPDRLSPLLAPMHAMLARTDPLNDGQMPARDQVPPSGNLLGYVNADHLEVAIPRPRRFPWTLFLAVADVPRASIVLAAVDVAVADVSTGGATRSSTFNPEEAR